MAYEVYAKPTIEWWKAQVGKPCGKTNEYSAFMDSYKFYNTPKNGSANSCAIFYDTGVMKTMLPEPNADAARAVLCEPNIDNCGAGCVQKVQYYKSAGRYYTKTKDAQSGDEVFFQKSNGQVYHTGALVDWSDVKKKLYVVEGNTNGGMVALKEYAYGDPKIAGFGRPKWTGWEPPKEEPAPDPEPEPIPADPEKPAEPAQKSVDELAHEVIEGLWGNGKERADRLTAAGYSYDDVQARVNEILGIKGTKYTVHVNSYLNIRNAPNGPVKVGKLYNGDKVTVYEERDGWGRIGTGKWVSMDFLK